MFVGVAMTVGCRAVVMEVLMFMDMRMGVLVGMRFPGSQLLPSPQE